MGIYLNQVGYVCNKKKTATTTRPGKYQMLKASEHTVICEKTAVNEMFDEAAGEKTYSLDF